MKQFGLRNSDFGLAANPKSEIRSPQSDQWFLIIDPPSSGTSNMAVDAALLAEAEASQEPLTIVRFYQWRTPTVSLGRSQKVETSVDAEFCRSAGLDIVRRPTGGRVVLHDDELTYAVISNDPLHFGQTIYGNYKKVSEALCLGINRIGVPAVLAPETRKPQPQARGADPPCFLSPSRYELMVDGRKIAGSAQRRLRRSFLQHGSMPLTCDRERLAMATRLDGISVLYREMAGISEFLPCRPTIDALTAALVRSFEQQFGIMFRPLPAPR